MSDDHMLGQNMIDVQNEGRLAAMLGDQLVTTQASICTSDDNCQAAADGHHDDCPVEHQLRKTFGF